MPDGLRAAERPGLRMLWHVSDIAKVLSRVRLKVAPLLFGAGVRDKVLESLAAGVPCACTPVAAEGLDLPPAELARVIHRLHEDAAQRRMRRGGARPRRDAGVGGAARQPAARGVAAASGLTGWSTSTPDARPGGAYATRRASAPASL